MKARRTLEDVDRYYTPAEIYKMILEGPMPEAYPIPKTTARNKALCALAYLTAGRISEVLSLKKDQFETQKRFIVITNMAVVKRKKWRGIPVRPQVLLPLKGPLADFTALVENYLSLVDGHLFPMSRKHAHRIITHITGKWPHWFRAQAESYIGAKVGNDELAIYLKVDPKSTFPYKQINESRFKSSLLK